MSNMEVAIDIRDPYVANIHQYCTHTSRVAPDLTRDGRTEKDGNGPLRVCQDHPYHLHVIIILYGPTYM